ncbi:MAG: TetR/AcrR family transcriptional regulator [Janthinobacterium lividum]
MAGPHTARARARAQTLVDIRRVALEQLAVEGSAGLSLRAVARELGVVPSALYRYVANRDELVTALVLDAYAELAVAVTTATSHGLRRRQRRRWQAGAQALRSWALAQPARFQLLYGSPVPGYAAPPETIGPALAVVLAMLAPVIDAAPASPHEETPIPSRVLSQQLKDVATGLGIEVPPALLARAIAAWSEVIGLVVLELGGHFVGGFEPADALFDAAVRDQTDRLGLRN